jgi:tetratricopeptide (TPR) repeat protein
MTFRVYADLAAFSALFLLASGLCGGAMDPALVHARDAQDRPALDKMMAAARAAAERTKQDADAQYRLALISSIAAEVALEVKDNAAAERAATGGVRAADTAIALNPNNAEYYRVLGTLCGQVIPANLLAGLSYGKRAKDAIEKAKQMDPKSALVWIADGVGNYYLPAALGGGPDLAIRSFQRALQLDPNSAEAWLWLGLAQRKKHDNGEARISFGKSLALDSNRIWAKQQLDKTPPK